MVTFQAFGAPKLVESEMFQPWNNSVIRVRDSGPSPPAPLHQHGQRLDQAGWARAAVNPRTLAPRVLYNLPWFSSLWVIPRTGRPPSCGISGIRSLWFVPRCTWSCGSCCNDADQEEATLMSLADRLEAARKPVKSKFEQWVDTLSDRDREALIASVTDEEISTADLLRCLQDEGCKVGKDTVSKWRRAHGSR